ncbi:T9SS type A sorting domain-containing protein [Pedobacter sp. UBA4863]|uniref:T9SS type A sorting domain-containing protein n=1 Tax=Pedobacter sp. UBA4863 TaxID=1947060 RepID=UPI0025DC51C3|nr:T9SS type A sorting domain-containing protein [Pedobacter sp. UBA4863]
MKKNLLRALPMLFVGLLFVLQSRAQTYYVDAAAGNDGNAGTQASPKKTIQAAIDAATGASTIYISSGTYAENVNINKSDIALIGSGSGANGNLAPTPINTSLHTLVTGGAGTRGIQISGSRTNVTVRDIAIVGYAGEGFYAPANANNLTVQNLQVNGNCTGAGRGGIFIDGGITNVTITGCAVQNNGTGASSATPRGIGIWNNNKDKITITNNYVIFTSCCGIDLNDGTASGVNISDNTLIAGSDKADSGIGILGLKAGNGANIIAGNTITVAKRYGIEIKNPAGSGLDDEMADGAIIVKNNIITRLDAGAATIGTEARDLAGIAVFRRSFTAGNPSGYIDVPSGVVIKGNTIDGFQQPNANGEGYGIVVEGVRMTVKNNTVKNCDIGIQRQAGNASNYYKDGIVVGTPAQDADQVAAGSPYFNRGNSPYSANIVLSGNDLSTGNTVQTRDEFALNSYLGDAQFVYNVDKKANYATINLGVEYATAGNTLQLSENTFDGRVTINKSLTIDGLDKTKANLTYTGLAITGNGGGIPTIFTVAAQNVTIKNITFTVDLTKIHSAIHSYGNVAGIVITDNNFVATATGALPGAKLGYGRRNAVSINVDAYDNFDYVNVNTGITGVTIQRNTVQGFIGGNVANGGFRSGFSVDRAKDVLIGGNSAADGNTIQTINHDVTSRFFTDGDVTVKNNTLNGGGLEMSSTNNAAGTVIIENNTFNGAASNAYTSQVRLQGNTNSKTFILKNNTFSNTKWGLSLENFRNILIEGNTFTPSVNDFRLITVNTKMILSTDAGATFPLGLDLRSNTFNGLSSATLGKALAFYNHKEDGTNNYQTGEIKIGGVGVHNTFGADIPTFIYVDNNNGNATKDGANVGLTGYPEYGSNIAITTTGYWKKDIIANANRFYVDGQLRYPQLLTSVQMTELDGKLFDKKDDPNIGEVLYYFPVTNVNTNVGYATIQSAVDAATVNDELRVDPGTYAEKISINKKLTIKGPNFGVAGTGARVAEAKIIPNVTDLAIASRAVVTFVAGSEGSVFDGFEVNGDNPSLSTSGITAGGVLVDAAYGVSINDVGGITVQNNIVQNFGSTDGTPTAYLVGATTTTTPMSGILIKNNLLQNLNQFTPLAALDAVTLSNDVYAQILSNKFTNVRGGIQFVNAYRPNPLAGTFDAIIADNDITSYRIGLYYNLQYNSASPWTVRNNTFQSSTPIGGNTKYEAIRVESIQSVVNGNIIGNTIVGNKTARENENSNFLTYGISFNNNVNTTGAFLVKNNDISDVKYGIGYTADNGTTLSTNVRYIGGNIHNVANYVAYAITSGTPTFADANLPSTQLDGKIGEDYTSGELADIYTNNIIDKDDNALHGKVNLVFPIKNITQGTAFTTLQAANDDVLTLDNDVISIKNDVSVYGNLGNVAFTKTNSIEIAGNALAALSFTNLTANAPGKTITFTNPATVAGNFTLTAGKITPSASFTLNGSVATTPGIANFINGAVTINNVSSDVLIPVGKNNRAAYVELTGASGAASSFTVEYFPAAYVSSIKGPGLTSVSSNEYWAVNRTSGSLTAKVKLYSFDLVASGFGILDDAVVSEYSAVNSRWETFGSSAFVNGIPGSVTANVVSSNFGYFTFGANTTVLPVALLSFTAQPATGGALVKWSTAKEENNAKFEIEKSFDGKNFFVIDSRKGEGTAASYEFLDLSFRQSAYYRLVQFDAGGKKTTYSDLTKFVKGLDNSLAVVAYPNPATAKLYVSVASSTKENVKVLLTDLTGKTLRVKDAADSSQPIELDVAGIARGSYILQVIKNSGNVSKKILKL